jgi:hypothetical protein
MIARVPKPPLKVSSGSSAMPAANRMLSGINHVRGPWNPTNYELWVENGVVWDLQRTWILGFIDYASIGPYFAQTSYLATPQIFAGSPFSMTDFPVYGFQLRLGSGQVVPGSYFIFSAISMLSYVPNAWSSFSAWRLTRNWTSPPTGAGPLVPAANLRSFVAGTPGGQKTLSASYVMYVPPEQYWTTTFHTWPPG